MSSLGQTWSRRSAAAVPGAEAILTWRATAWRSRVVMVLLMLGLILVAGRAFYLQHINVAQWQKRAEVRYERLRTIAIPRGEVTDRNGNVLAVSISESRVAIVPRQFRTDHPRLAEFAELVGETSASLKRKISQAKGFFYVASELDLDAADRIRSLRMPGVEVDEEFRRHYPYGEAFAGLLGFTDRSGVGQEGLERYMEARLHSVQGQERVLVDRRNKVFGGRLAQASQAGSDIRLTLDAGLQSIAHTAVAQALQANRAQGASAVVVDVQTGEIMAMASAPSFDPNQRGRLDANRVRNRAVMDSFEPGSTLKPFALATALDRGLVTPQTKIQTAPGALTISGRTIRDSHASGTLSLEEVLQKSSNVGTAKVALQLSPEDMYRHYQLAGLGVGKPLQLPGAVSGRLRDWKTWVPIEQATMSYGHGIAVSLVQLASAYTVFARDGDRVPLKLELDDQPVLSQPVFTPKTARAIRKMLEMAAGPGGTAPKAQISGFRVAGKTGTAHKPDRGGYAKNRYVSSFVGFVPADQPRYVIAVMVDEPSAGKHYGGEVAAPVFAQIASESLRRLQMSPNPAVQVLPTQLLVQEGT